jgi:polysaccharide export outer membrane protein
MTRPPLLVCLVLLLIDLVPLIAGCGPKVRVEELSLEEAAERQPVDTYFEQRPEYRIQVGDRMRIEFLSDPEPSRNASEVTVRPDGRISLRGVDDVQAAGRTPAELDSTLTARFARLLVDPEISVILEDFARETIYVLGEVNRPREIQTVGPMGLLQAIASAGGYKLGANRNDVVIVRRLEGGRIGAFKVDTEPLMEANQDAQGVVLHAQDVVIVPKTNITKVGDFVTQYFEAINPALLTAFWVDRIINE